MIEDWRRLLQRRAIEFSPAATEPELEYLETRLGRTLPPSYKQFLRTTNGWVCDSAYMGRFWGTKQVAWFREWHPGWHQECLEAYAEAFGESARDERLASDETQILSSREIEGLPNLLVVSEKREDRVCLLNPYSVNTAGEWEAWLFSPPVLERYGSFEEMMIVISS